MLLLPTSLKSLQEHIKSQQDTYIHVTEYTERRQMQAVNKYKQ